MRKQKAKRERPGCVYIMENRPEVQAEKGRAGATRAVIDSRQTFLAGADSA